MDITLTIDLEDPTTKYAPDGRYVVMTGRLLDLFDRMERKATFFTVGRVAEAAPLLIREIAGRGHEIAYHSHNHVALTLEDRDRFARECARDKDRLEQLTGREVIGFRAPQYSLTPQTTWALDVLGDCGFRYSSSLMPTNISRFGFSDAPTVPFLWPNGMTEFPLPVASFGKVRLPYLGGIYLYTMPFCVVRRFLERAKPDEVLWTYAHPYDFDDAERFVPMPNTPLWMSLVLWRARRVAAKKIARVCAYGKAPPLGQRVLKDSR